MTFKERAVYRRRDLSKSSGHPVSGQVGARHGFVRGGRSQANAQNSPAP